MGHRYAAVVGAVLAVGLSAAPARAGRGIALFDQGHGQRFRIEAEGELDLSGLAGVFREAGYEVRSTAGRIGPETLSGAAVLVTSGLFVPYEPAELAAIRGFVERGGGLSAMLHVAPTYAGLHRELGVLHSPGVLHETQRVLGGNSLDFEVASFLEHPLTEGLRGFRLYGAWAVMNAGPGAQTVAFTSRGAWIDADRDGRRGPREPLHAYGVLVAGTLGEGRFAVFGDDAVFQNRFLDADNRALAGRLARWLGQGR